MAHCTLKTSHFTLQIKDHTLHTARWRFHTSHCTLKTSHSTLHNEDFLLHTAQWSFHTAHFTLRTSHFTLKIAHLTLKTSHFTPVHKGALCPSPAGCVCCSPSAVKPYLSSPRVSGTKHTGKVLTIILHTGDTQSLDVCKKYHRYPQRWGLLHCNSSLKLGQTYQIKSMRGLSKLIWQF